MKPTDINSLILLCTGAITGALTAAIFFPATIALPEGWGDIIGSALGILGAYLVAKTTFRMEQRARAIEANTPLYNQIEFAQQELSKAIQQFQIIKRETEKISSDIDSLENAGTFKRFYPQEFNNLPCLLAEIYALKALQCIKRNQENFEAKLEPNEIRWINETKRFLGHESGFQEKFEEFLSDDFYPQHISESDRQKLHNKLIITTTNGILYDLERNRDNLLRIKNRLEVSH